MIDVEALAALVDTAALTAREIEQLSARSELSLDDAYAVQKSSAARRIGRGERRAGMKMGCTSRAKMIQMGIGDLIWGCLTDGMRVEEGGTLKLASYVHPRVEPEVAFVLGRDLPRLVSPAEALAVVTGVAPALEIIDSRYKAFKFSLSDVVADNASSSGFVLGPWSPRTVDVANLGMILEVDMRPVEIGSSAAILGHPLRSLVAAARLAADAGESLRAGDVVMAGGATAAVPQRPGQHVRARGVQVIDLTPAARGPHVVPVVNLDADLDAPNLNMVIYGGQATIPIVAAVARVAKVHYAEIVASIASLSAGPGTRANFDEFTETTARALSVVGGATRGKAIIVLNPAEPPLVMRDTIFTLSEPADRARITASVEARVERVRACVPGYRLKQSVQFDDAAMDAPLDIPGIGKVTGLKTSVFLEVVGAGHYLPAYAGNLDIMTSAALACAERLAETRLQRAR